MGNERLVVVRVASVVSLESEDGVVEISPGDSRAWAAYVMGHHPWTIRSLQVRQWDESTWVPDGPSEWIRRELVEQVAELDEAIFQLGLTDATTASSHIELRNAYDQFRQAQSQILSPDHGFSPVGPTPGKTAWMHLVEASQVVLFNDSVWKPACQLGCQIGQLEHDVSAPLDETDIVHPAQIVGDKPSLKMIAETARVFGDSIRRDDIRQIAQRFEYQIESFPDAMQSEYPTLPIGPRDFTHIVAQMDAEIRQILTDQPPHPVLLYLSDEKMEFLGKQIAMPTKFDAALSFLWVLAERPRTKVPRDVIWEKSGITRSLHDLKFARSELINRYLRDIVEGYYGSGGSRPEEATKHFIKGHRGKGGHPGPYELEIDPRQVRVDLPRPSWMPSRA